MISNIQALRAFAAIAVVVFHAIDASINYGHIIPISEGLKRLGASGVDLFFVISGFIMVYTQADRRRAPVEFMFQRIRRVVPLYWFYTFLLGAIFLVDPEIFSRIQIDIEHFAASLLFSSLYIFEAPPVVGVGWTLEFEMFFYVVFAISLFFKGNFTAYGFILSTLSLLVLCGAGSLLLLEFLLGVTAGTIYCKIKQDQRKVAVWLSWAILLLGVFLLTLSVFAPPDLHRVLIWGVPASFILLGSLFIEQTSSRLLIFLGAASYSIYLSHFFTVPVYMKLMNFFFLGLDPFAVMVLCVLFSTIVGAILFALVEIPLSVWSGRRGWRSIGRKLVDSFREQF